MVALGWGVVLGEFADGAPAALLDGAGGRGQGPCGGARVECGGMQVEGVQGPVVQCGDDLVVAGIGEQAHRGAVLVGLGVGPVEYRGVGLDQNGVVRAAVTALEPPDELVGYQCFGEGVGLGSGA